MTILLIACSAQGYRLMQKLEQDWKRCRPDTDLVCKVKCAALPEISESGSLSGLVGEWFDRADAIVFLCAAGIAVRSIAPYIGHKSEDPAVLAADETGKFCISLLSGHAGGANELTEFVSSLLGAVPVITTATDREQKFAADEFARKNGLAVTDWKAAKEISVRILAGERIGLLSGLPLEGCAPDEVHVYTSDGREGYAQTDGGRGRKERQDGDFAGSGQKAAEQAGIWISCRKAAVLPFPLTLQLVPQLIVAGIGCKKGTPEEKITEALSRCLTEEEIREEALCAVASIDLKAQESGILAFCEKNELPFVTKTAAELRALPGDFSCSDFVEQTTGVSNVCERSAAAVAEGKLLCRKKVYGGVTAALAIKKGSVKF